MSWGAFLFNSFRDAAESSSYRVVVKCGSERKRGKKERRRSRQKEREKEGDKPADFFLPLLSQKADRVSSPLLGHVVRRAAAETHGAARAVASAETARLSFSSSLPVAFGYELAGRI